MEGGKEKEEMEQENDSSHCAPHSIKCIETTACGREE